MLLTYPEFFKRITGQGILPYQERYGADPFSPKLVIIPTGLGKTDCVLLPWLYAQKSGAHCPTRLIIVLPRQNLTIQTAENARTRVKAAELEIEVLELMGGRKDNKETINPAKPTVIVSTQDLYFSRALNRGYARRPPRWPIDFALYNQDCLIVLDEIQLMAEGLATSTQLAAFRKEFLTFGSAPSVWMSATVNPAWLQTVDSPQLPPELRLSDADRKNPLVTQRIKAAKSLVPAPESCRTPAGCAAFVKQNHRPNTRTLVIANTVLRARDIFRALSPDFPSAVLLHSRFRPADRTKAAENLQNIPEAGQIVVATQVLEAGVDITARLLVTDIAPWGSLVQRFGRVNRYGTDGDAEIYWVDQPTYAKQKDPTAPYTTDSINRASTRLKTLKSAAPADLPEEDGPEPWQHVLRRADLLDLFDTSSDLSGNQLDVSRFIRASEEKDVYLAWRHWEGASAPPPISKELSDAELCPVPIGELREFAKKHQAYSWSFANEEWDRIDNQTPIYPGMMAVTRCAEGGYTETEGWSPESKAVVNELQPQTEEMETNSSDAATFKTYRQTLLGHTNRVVQEIEKLVSAIAPLNEYAPTLLRAAHLHDWGKVHHVFQRTMHQSDAWTELLAKREGRGRHSRKHFRHEIASALAMLATGEPDLATYLVAAHHGKVRMAIRSKEGEHEEGKIRTALGIHDQDPLPEAELGTGVKVPSVTLSLEIMEFGAAGGSWTERAIRLRDELGPFRLAYLEMILRAADQEASDNPKLEAVACQ